MPREMSDAIKGLMSEGVSYEAAKKRVQRSRKKSLKSNSVALAITEETSSFEKELAVLLNRYSKENESDTPDFILAGYISGCLSAFTTAIRCRRDWYR